MIVPVQEINLLFITELESPEEASAMVCEYARKTKKDEWQEFGKVFNNSTTTVVLENDGSLIGYCNAEIDRDGNLLLNHGFLRRGIRVDYVDALMELIFFKMTDHLGGNKPTKMLMHHKGPDKLWEKWGFQVSTMKIYERDMGGNNG